jgi:hypothetical protein
MGGPARGAPRRIPVKRDGPGEGDKKTESGPEKAMKTNGQKGGRRPRPGGQPMQGKSASAGASAKTIFTVRRVKMPAFFFRIAG